MIGNNYKLNILNKIDHQSNSDHINILMIFYHVMIKAQLKIF